MDDTGFFITIEGVDGSGKTTQCRRLARKLLSRGLEVIETHEPSSMEIGCCIRKRLKCGCDPHVLGLLFAADRLEHVAEVIDPALATGKIVVCDRYVFSSLVYNAMDCGHDWIAALNKNARVPDLSIILDLPGEIAAERVRKRTQAEHRDIYENPETLKKASDLYHLITQQGFQYVGVRSLFAVDATKTEAEVGNEILRVVEEALDAQ